MNKTEIQQVLDAMKLLDPSLKFENWENGDGIQIQAQLSAAAVLCEASLARAVEPVAIPATSFEQWWDSEARTPAPDTYKNWEESCRQAFEAGKCCAAQQWAVAPEGLKLVPVKLTDDMLYEAQDQHIMPPRMKRLWKILLDAAPATPQAAAQPSQLEDNQPAIDGPFAKTGELAKQFGATEAESVQIQTRVDFLAGGLRSVTPHDKRCLAEFSSFLRMDGEAAKLSDILSGMTEGGGHYEDPKEIYADDFSPSDGDVYVVRAADLLREQATEIARLLDLSMKVAQPSQAVGWIPIAQAPQDDTPVDLWRGEWKERATDMRRVVLAPDNIFYEPVSSGPCVVRDATHFMIVKAP